MPNICTGQQQILIILTWIVKAITKVLKKAIKFWGTSIFYSVPAYCLHRTSGFFLPWSFIHQTQHLCQVWAKSVIWVISPPAWFCLVFSLGVPGKVPILYVAKVSFRVPQRNIELREEKQKSNFLEIYDNVFKNYFWIKAFDDYVFISLKLIACRIFGFF